MVEELKKASQLGSCDVDVVAATYGIAFQIAHCFGGLGDSVSRSSIGDMAGA